MSEIQKVCVIGSGVMGAGIAAAIANASYQVLLLDIADKNPFSKNAILEQALENIKHKKPQALVHPSKINFITIGNLDDDLGLITDCDLVIEAIVEKLEIKQALYNSIVPYLNIDAILASNTSTLLFKQLTSQLAQDVKARFLILHFFNPVRYMNLLELVSDTVTKESVIKKAESFLTHGLGKTIINSNDSHGFIANRVGCFFLELSVRRAIDLKLNSFIIDKLLQKLFSMPATGIFGLYDLIGHDVMQLISNSLTNSLPLEDRYNKIYTYSEILSQMIELGLIGNKGAGGFYKLSIIDDKKIKSVMNFTDMLYTVENAEEVNAYIARFSDIRSVFSSKCEYGIFFNYIFHELYSYIVTLIPSAANDFNDIDTAMRLGYNWKLGPIELFHHIKKIYNSDHNEPKFLSIQLPYVVVANANANSLHNNSKEVLKNESAALLMHRDHLIFTIHTKMSCIDKDVLHLLLYSIDYSQELSKNLYIYSPKCFSVGADIKFINHCIANKDFKELKSFLTLGQTVMLRLKYASINIVSCANAFALGGGCEILLHSDFIIMHSELKAGLVEMGIGLLPGWGGVKEMLVRSSGDKTILVRNLRNILEMNKSSSAEYFCQDYNINNYSIVMNENDLLNEALNKKRSFSKLSNTNNTKYTLPSINLFEEIDITSYNNKQLELMTSFQDIINSDIVTEEELLEFEREYFLKLAFDNT